MEYVRQNKLFSKMRQSLKNLFVCIHVCSFFCSTDAIILMSVNPLKLCDCLIIELIIIRLFNCLFIENVENLYLFVNKVCKIAES